MNEINKLIQQTKCNSSVDNFTVNLEKAFTLLVENMVEDVRTYKEDSVCAFKQEVLADFLTKKYLRD